MNSNHILFLPKTQVNRIEQLKEAFIKNKHPRLKKEFAASRHQPFGKTSDYVLSVREADCVKTAKLIKLVECYFRQKLTYCGLDPVCSLSF